MNVIKVNEADGICNTRTKNDYLVILRLKCVTVLETYRFKKKEQFKSWYLQGIGTKN